MKEMVYQKHRIYEVLHSGEYRGHSFAIMNLGTHPTAYVEDKLGCDTYDDIRVCDIDVYWGFTYKGSARWDENDHREYLGWDYAHCGDRYGEYAGVEHTTEEIFEEVKRVIDQLIEVEESND